MSKTLTVTARYQYQAWQTAHRVLRSNVRCISAADSTRDDVTMTFETVDAPRWPVALKHYQAQARRYRAAAVSEMMHGSHSQAQQFAEMSAQFRTRVQDAQTGHVSNPRTLLRRGL